MTEERFLVTGERRLSGDAMETEGLNCLVAQWKHLAKCKFQSAQHEKDPMGKRLIEHGAICYLNCARELKEALAALSPQEQANPSGDRT